MDSLKKCKECGADRDIPGRRVCKKCNVKRVAKYCTPQERRRKSLKICVLCENLKPIFKKGGIICGDCFRKSKDTGYTDNKYKKFNKSSRDAHRVIAENILGRPLRKDEVVHHVDEDKSNNNLDNLWVMSLSDHASLHAFLRIEKMFWEKFEKSSWSDVGRAKKNQRIH